MHALDTTVAVAAGFALVAGLFIYWLRRHWINQPMLALGLGVAIGPAGFGWLDLAAHGGEREIIEVVARYTLAITLVGAGLEVHGYLSEHWRSLATLIFGGAALMWATSSILVGWIVGTDLMSAVLIGAVLALIDPILAATVATGRIARENLPARLRHLLSAESSARHGLGLVLVLLPAYLLTRPATEAWAHWLRDVVVWKGLVAILVGGLVGYAAGRAQRWSEARRLAEEDTGPLAAILLALSLAVMSVVELMGSDALLAVLVAGVAYARARIEAEKGEEIETQQREYQELIKQVLQVPVFLLLGAALPWAEWAGLGWRAPALVVAVLLLRRIPVILLLKPLIGQLPRWDEALFVGWFGPIGVGALYLATVAHKETANEQVWIITTLLVAATVVVTDLTATPLSEWLAGRPNEGPPEPERA